MILNPSDGRWFQSSLESGAITGTGVVANAPLFSMRNITGSAKRVFISEIKVKLIVTVAFTGAQEIGLFLQRATGFSASDSGGTATTAIQRLDNITTASIFASGTTGDLRIASTTLLTAGTRTVDTTTPIWRNTMTGVGATANTTVIDETIKFTENAGDMPLILPVNEGIVIANKVAFPVAGTVKLLVTVKWRELV